MSSDYEIGDMTCASASHAIVVAAERMQWMQRMRAKEQRRLAVPGLTRCVRVGRNKLCPCGSGVKFKKCCLRQ